MRTDSVIMSSAAIKEVRSYIKEIIGKDFLPTEPRIYKSKAKNAQEAHECIRPTNITLSPDKIKKYLNVDEHRLYEIIWQRALSSQMASAIINQVSIDIENLDDQGVTEISIYTQDHLGLFARTCAGLALAGTSVQDARIVTTKDGMTVNTFLIRSANSFSFIEDKNRISTLEDTIRKTISEERDPKILIKEFKSIQIPSRKDSFVIEPRVLIDNLSSKTHTLIEINSKDKIGLLHTLASELFLMGLHISTARISTYGVRVVDVFYIKNMTGGKITEKDKIDVIKSKLMKAINEHKDVSSKVLEKI